MTSGIYIIFTLLILFTAVFSYINYRFIKLPATIGIRTWGRLRGGISVALSLSLPGICTVKNL